MPEITLDLTLFATAFVTVLVIMDPVGNISSAFSATSAG
jgi:small neutral amino acid transporter SnatA (MarC family)